MVWCGEVWYGEVLGVVELRHQMWVDDGLRLLNMVPCGRVGMLNLVDREE